MLEDFRQAEYGLGDLVKIPFSCSPRSTIFLVIQYLLVGIIPTLQVLVTAKFIDSAIAIYGGKMLVSQIYPQIGALLGLIAYAWILQSLVGFANTRLRLSLQRKYRTSLVEKRTKLAYEHIENPETWDLISRVSTKAEDQILTGFNTLLVISSNGLRIGGLLLVLAQQVWWAALLITLFSVPLFALGIKSGKQAYEVQREVAKLRRKADYLSDVLLERDSVEERTMFGYTDFINEIWHKYNEEARLRQLEVGRKWYIRMKSGSIITTFTAVLIVAVLLQPTLRGLMSLGLFLALVNATFSLVDIMSWQFAIEMEQLAKSREYLKDLSCFMDLTETEGAQSLPLTPSPNFTSLEFKKVSFTYPGTKKKVLDQVSFRIEAGGHYSFVGPNGSGKTTITKLITGLYPGYSGSILLNGQELQDFSQEELKAFFNVVYQDFGRYSISLRDNVALGGKASEASIEEVVKQVELTEVVNNWSLGYDTPLGKIKEEGQDLSGGEWQRVAMARAIYNPAPFRILDEPTAALDPISESHLYEQFERISKNTTTVFISHRLGSTKLADHIFVINQGKIVEQGSHGQLMEGEGLYQEMYENQRGWYS